MINPNRPFFILALFCLTGILPVFAQWSTKDSLWLGNALSGGDTIRLNPEAMESIRKGTFLNLDQPRTPMESMSVELPLVKDFSEYFDSRDTVRRPFKLTDLPSHIVLRYYNPPKPPGMLEFSDAYFYFYLKNSTRGIRTPGYGFAHGLNMAFSPEYRRLMKNRKNAANLKYYNDLPPAELLQKQRQYFSAHPEQRKPANAAEAEKIKEALEKKGNEMQPDSLTL